MCRRYLNCLSLAILQKNSNRVPTKYELPKSIFSLNFRNSNTPVNQPLPPALPSTSPSPTSPPTTASRSLFLDQRTPVRRSSSPTLSPSKRLFHSPPLATPTRSPTQPPRPSSTPNYSVNVSIIKAISDESEDDVGDSPKMPIKPNPIRLNPNDPVWRPF